jgi:soluble lytic murein transglycosylase
MSFGRLRHLTAVVGATCALVAAPAHADSSPEYALLAANDAFRAGDALKLARFAERLRGHVLEPYAEYWLMTLRLEDTPAREVSAFLAKHAGTVYAELLRADWLRVLGKRADWERFERELASLALDDLEIRCYTWGSRLALGDHFAAEEAMQMWLEPKELPAGCITLEAKLVAAGRLDADLAARARAVPERPDRGGQARARPPPAQTGAR